MFVVYSESAQVLGVVDAAMSLEDYKQYLDDGQSAISIDEMPDADLVDFCVLNGVFQRKKEMNLVYDSSPILADGVAMTKISSIPRGTLVDFSDGSSEVVDDGVLEYSVTQPGSYKLVFTSPHFLNEEVLVEAYR